MRKAALTMILVIFGCGGPVAGPVAVFTNATPLVATLATPRPPSAPSGSLQLDTRAAKTRLTELARAATDLGATSEIQERFDLALSQVDDAGEQIAKALASTGSERRGAARRALLNLRTAPLTLSLVAVDLRLAAHWKQLPSERALAIEAETKALRAELEQAALGAEQLLGR